MKIELLKGTTEPCMQDALPVTGSLDTSGRLTVGAPDYSETDFFTYHLPLGDALPPFPATNNRRTVWLPAVGFKNGLWHDGPLVVTEADGTVSSYIPTGTAGSLLLARDGVAAKGWDAGRIAVIEGDRADRLLRGCIAALRESASDLRGNSLTVALPPDACADATPTHVLVWLTLLRAALGPACALLASFDPGSKVNPRLRRCCEHTAFALAPWSEPDADLAAIFSWYQLNWTDELVAAINAHGSIIPG